MEKAGRLDRVRIQPLTYRVSFAKMDVDRVPIHLSLCLSRAGQALPGLTNAGPAGPGCSPLPIHETELMGRGTEGYSHGTYDLL